METDRQQRQHPAEGVDVLQAFKLSSAAKRISAFLLLVSFLVIFQFLGSASIKRNVVDKDEHWSSLPATVTTTKATNNALSTNNTTTARNSSRKSFNVSYENSMDWAATHLQAIFRTNKQQPSCFEKCLLEAAVPFYVYPEYQLFSDPRYDIRNLTGNTLDVAPLVRPKHYREGGMYEIAILNALLNHSLRTESERDAQLFVIPVSFATIFYDRPRQPQNQGLFDEIRVNLQKSTPFQQGKPHVLVSMTSPLFNPIHKHSVGHSLRRLYDTLKSVVVVARTDDYNTANYAYRHNATPAATGDFRGFDDLFTVLPLSTYQFSVGLGGESWHLPLIAPTWDKFQKSTYFIFYHTRSGASIADSTAYRHAPVVNVTHGALPRSSIGWEIPPKGWKLQFVDSKFCLVIRGDTPHSHSLFNAIKVGCIPVVVSDWYPFFAPAFPTTLDMRDFCIFIPEDYFLSHTQTALQSLQYLPDHVIKAKLKAMEWAQRVMLFDHPHSLFAPAFVREAMASLSRPAGQF